MARSASNTSTTSTPPAGARLRVRGERHRALLQAVLAVVGEEGVDAVRHRRIADEAGVPLGSTTYYFASREDMLAQALAYFVDEDLEELTAQLGDLVEPGADPRRLAGELVALIDRQTVEHHARARAQYALFHEATRLQELRPVVREWTEAWCDVLERLFTAIGARDPRLEARMFLAMVDGLVLGQLTAPEDDFDEAVLRPAVLHWLTTAAPEGRDG